MIKFYAYLCKLFKNTALYLHHPAVKPYDLNHLFDFFVMDAAIRRAIITYNYK